MTLLTAGPAVAVAVASAYGASALATDTYARPPGPEQGHHVALVIAAASVGAALARLALLGVERRLDAIRATPRLRRALPAAAVAVALAVVALAVALDAPGRVRDQYRAFIEGNVVQETTDTRQRLGAVGNNGRLDIWRVDLRQFRSAPVIGAGAGTFQLAWERERPGSTRVVDGHSLYLETAAELGVVGLVLAGPARRLRGADRHAAAAVLAAGGALLVHAGIDWDWEMPALFAWLFMAAGAAHALPAGAARRAAPGRLVRVLAGLACLLLAVTPLLVTVSQARLQTAGRAFARGDCAGAVDASLGSLDVLRVRPEPFELIGYCDIRAGRPDLALAAMEAARERDPDAWQYAYGGAVARAAAGRDPRPAIAEAARLNPHEPRVRDLARALDSDRPARWRRAAARAKLPF
jgi:O-Antigen ligase